MALSLSFSPLLSSNTIDKPGLISHNCSSRKGTWITDASYSSKNVAFEALKVKATENKSETKVNSIICGDCEGNGYDKARPGGRKFRSSFSGKVLYLYKNSIPLTINIGTTSRSRSIISSVLGRQVKKETIIPDPDYRIPLVLLGMAGGFVYVYNLAAAVPLGLLGLLLLVQSTRVRFVFDGEALEVKVGDELQESGENAFVGGKNRWKYSTFVNWELWWPSFPVLVYFKETQTKPEGQIHFFPVIFNGKQLYDVMVERCGPSKTSGPK